MIMKSDTGGLKNVSAIFVQILIGFLKKVNGQILMRLGC